MFRRGGRANGGIMDGVQRQGYDGTDGNQTVVKDDPTKFQSDAAFLKEAMGERPEIKPYPYKGSDFFMGLGANILAAPGGQPILQTIGQAGINPLKTLAAQNLADYGNQQKNELSKYDDNRALIMSVYKNMDDDDKILTQKQVDFFMSEEGGSMTRAEALEQVLFRKSQSPTDVKRNQEIRDQKVKQDAINAIKNQYKDSAAFSDGISDPDATTLYNFLKNINEKKYEVYHDPNLLFIDDKEVGRKPRGNSDKRLAIRDYDPSDTTYINGRIYVDFITETAYVKQGQFFIPYEDYISESISTN